MKKEIKQSWFFHQSPEEVWEYLTAPDLIEQWLMRTEGFEPVAGKEFRFTFPPKPDSRYEGIVRCKVLEAIPFTKLSYSWNGRTRDMARSYFSVVTWTLVRKDKGTELELVHSGFELMEDILMHTSGWKGCLKRFEENINAVEK
jgi:uncharacterized protein YndB with AHSA1/START domain